MKNFIRIKENELSEVQCQTIIDHFEKSSEKKSGVAGDYAVDKSIKDSTDLTLLFSEET